jgi:SAM-dependent methyltransferase
VSDFSISRILAQTVAFPLHRFCVSSKRDRRLAELIVSLLSDSPSTGLDIGCGSGNIARLVQDLRPQISMQGTDVAARPDAVIPVQEFDGKCLPFANESFDFAMLVDVLHHSLEPHLILGEALRVSRKFVIIKDHFCQSGLDRLTLQFMDWVGNRAHDVPLPFNYLSQAEWQKLYDGCNASVASRIEELNLYSQPFSLIFDRHLHFMNRLEKSN